MMTSDWSSVMASLRSSPLYASFTMAPPSVIDAPMPRASTARATTRISTLGETAHIRDPAVNSKQPVSSTGLRPNRSLIGPAKTIATVETNRNENTVLLRYSSETSNASCIVGSAGAYMSRARI